MDIEKDKPYAVVTGDIVGSSRLSEDERIRLHRAMTEGSAALRAHFGEFVPLDLDIYRGDGWQLLVTAPERALRVGLLYRTFIRVRMESRKLDTRMAIGVGTVDFLPNHRVSSGDGEAFRISGSALESIPKSARMKFDCPKRQRSSTTEAIDTVIQLLDAIAIEWTEGQALAVAGSLKGWTQERIAGSWSGKPISQQAVAQHLDRAKWNAVERGLGFFERRVRMMEKNHE